MAANKGLPTSALYPLLLISFFLFSGEGCEKGYYEEPCGAPCKYGDHLIYVQTHGIRSEKRLRAILDSFDLKRRSDFQLEPRYLIGRNIGITWLGEHKKEMTLTEYNLRMNKGVELFSKEMDYFYRELLYSEQELDGERQLLHKLREALNMDLGGENDAIGYLADLCSSYDDGCEMGYPSIVPVHDFAVEVKNPSGSDWSKDSAFKHFPFFREYQVHFRERSLDGDGHFRGNDRKGTVTMAFDLRDLSCVEVQSFAYEMGDHPLTVGMQGGSILDMATPVDCSWDEVERREKRDL